jgi:hypothetical protein
MAFEAFRGMMGLGALTAWFGAFLLLGIILAIVFYVYTALVWSTIAKKLGYAKPWLAWIPIANVFLLPILAKKNWAWGFIFLVPIVNIVFFIIWTWNIFEQRKYPGWLSLVPIAAIIPFIGWIASLAFLVIMGMVAWNDKK